MIIKFAKTKKVSVICIVRKEEHEKECIDLGASDVINMNDPSFEEKISQLTRKKNCRLAFDPIGGNFTAKLFHVMPEGSDVYVYGNISGQEISGLGAGDLIFRQKRLLGFHLAKYIAKEKSTFGLIRWASKLMDLLQKDLSTKINGVYPFEDVHNAILDYVKNMSAGKVLLSTATEI